MKACRFILQILRALARRAALPTLSLALVFSACQSDPASTRPGSKSPSSISLQRTPGDHPENPSYVVTLFSDGGVMFEGYANVKSKGTFTKHIPPEQAVALFVQLDTIDFWERQPRYNENRAKRGGDDIIVAVTPPDAPSDVITARHNGRFKRIDGLAYAPRELIEFKQRVEQTVGLADWVGVQSGTTRD